MGVDIAEQQQPEQDEVLEQCSASYGFLQADLSEPSSCTRVAEETRQRFGPAIHVLINNAAVASPQPEEDPAKRTAVWLKTLATNLTGLPQSGGDVGLHPRRQAGPVTEQPAVA